jgi:hypothetical protein
MTILAAAYLDGHVIAISDRLNLWARSNCTRAVYQDKWMTLPAEAPSLLWGWAGWSDIGSLMAPQVRRSASEWQTLKEAVSGALRSMNEQTPSHTTDCLAAGWIKGVPGILHFRSNGTVEGWEADRPSLGERFVGVGSFGADLAWRFAIGHLKAERSTENFRALLDLVIHEEGQLDGLERWDISPEGVPARREAVDPRLPENPPYFPSPTPFGDTLMRSGRYRFSALAPWRLRPTSKAFSTSPDALLRLIGRLHTDRSMDLVMVPNLPTPWVARNWIETRL